MSEPAREGKHNNQASTTGLVVGRGCQPRLGKGEFGKLASTKPPGDACQMPDNYRDSKKALSRGAELELIHDHGQPTYRNPCTSMSPSWQERSGQATPEAFQGSPHDFLLVVSAGLGFVKLGRIEENQGNGIRITEVIRGKLQAASGGEIQILGCRLGIIGRRHVAEMDEVDRRTHTAGVPVVAGHRDNNNLARAKAVKG